MADIDVEGMVEDAKDLVDDDILDDLEETIEGAGDDELLLEAILMSFITKIALKSQKEINE